MALALMDREIASGWDADHRLAAETALVAGVGSAETGGMWPAVLATLLVCVGVALLFVVTLVWLGRLLRATPGEHAERGR